MWKAVVHSPYIGEGPARVADCEGRALLPLEEKQSGVRLGRVGGLLRVGVDVVKNCLSGPGAVLQRLDNLHGFIRVNVAVVGKTQLSQCFSAVVVVLHREKETAIVSKDRIGDYARHF